MKVQFISSFAVVTADPAYSRKLFEDGFGLPIESPPGDEYAFTQKVDGCKHFGIWPLAQAAQACFGTDTSPTDRPIPQASVEFEVESPAAVAEASRELESRGYPSIHPPREEPWGQTIARILSPDGAIIGVSYTPPMHPHPEG